MTESARPELARFEPALPLDGTWKVVQYLPGKALALERPRPVQVRSLTQRAVLGIGAPLLLVALLLIGTTQARGELRWVTWPLAAIFFAIAVLGVFAVRGAARLLKQGAGLVLDARQGKARGALTEVPLAAVTAVKVEVFRGGKKDCGVAIRVMLREGELEGPLLSVPDPDWEDARDALLPLAAELARIAGVGLVLVHGAERVDWSRAEVEALPVGPSYEVA